MYILADVPSVPRDISSGVAQIIIFNMLKINFERVYIFKQKSSEVNPVLAALLTSAAYSLEFVWFDIFKRKSILAYIVQHVFPSFFPSDSGSWKRRFPVRLLQTRVILECLFLFCKTTISIN